MEHNVMLIISNTVLLIGAGLAFLTPLRKREKWWLWLPVGAVLAYLSMKLGYRTVGPTIFVYYLMTYLALVLVVNRATRLSPVDSCYCAVWITISAMAVQELWMSLRLAGSPSLTLDLRSGAELLVFSAVLFLVISRTAAKWMPRGDVYQVGLAQLAGAWLLGGMFVALSHVFMLPNPLHPSVRLIIALCQICCLMLLALQLQSYERRVAEKRLDILNLMCDFGAQQYAVSLKNMDAFSRKCQEMEEMIHRMEAHLPEEFRREASSVAHQAQLAADSLVKTGNQALDIVLTEKKLLADTKQTQLSCVADGKLLDFMETVDIYALFAFGLDTALEDVERIADESHRIIDILIHESQNFAVINTSHPLPRTGSLKNRNVLNDHKIMIIHRIVEKYHGMISMEKEDGFLTLRILLPLAQNKK